MNSRRKILQAALIASLLTGLAACDKLGVGGAGNKPVFKGVDITGAEYARTLNMNDQMGQPRTLGDFKGKVVVVFFGYTQCPDVCPTTLAELAQVKKLLGADGERVQGVFVTIDPERDTAELLKAYVANFDPGFVALRGTPDQTAAAAKEFKVFFAKVPGKTPDSYTMDHTAASFLFDAQGKVRVFSRYGAGAQVLADDLKILLAEKT
ncbi:MAG: SCO family protein [Burkholderiaceae bacterium]|nr:SCO family protein [Burkholderiaceae bacterium]MBT9501960.1 SCO family protein [Burkholderiaceae bacterium]